MISKRRGAFSNNPLFFYRGMPKRNLVIRLVMNKSPGSYTYVRNHTCVSMCTWRRRRSKLASESPPQKSSSFKTCVSTCLALDKGRINQSSNVKWLCSCARAILLSFYGRYFIYGFVLIASLSERTII